MAKKDGQQKLAKEELIIQDQQLANEHNQQINQDNQDNQTIQDNQDNQDNNAEIKNRKFMQSQQNVGPKPKHKRSKGFAVLIIFLIALGALVAYRFSQNMQVAEEVSVPPVHVTVTQAIADDISSSTIITGSIEAKDSVMVYAGMQGEVSSVYVEVGDYVEEGDRLFNIDSSQLSGNYTQAQAAYDLAQIGIDSAAQNLERMQALYDSDAIPLSQLEQAQTQYDSAVAQQEQASGSINAAGSAIAMTRSDAPISGFITEVNITEGAMPGQGSAAIVISTTDILQISTNISEYLISGIELGQVVDYKISTLSDDYFSGTVDFIGLAPASGSLTYPVDVSIAAEDIAEYGIMPGMFAEVHLIAEQFAAAIIVPSEAVFTRDGQTMLVVLDEANIPSLVPVELGIDNGQIVQILSGLEAGATVVVKGQHFVTEGEAVIVSAE